MLPPTDRSDELRREAEQLRRESQAADAAGVSDDAPLWIKVVGVVLSVGAVTGILWGIVAYKLGYRAGLGNSFEPPDSGAKRWVITILLAIGVLIPVAYFVFGYFFAAYLYTQGARVAALRWELEFRAAQTRG